MIISKCCFNVLSSTKACWRLTRYCNLACSFCFAESDQSRTRIPANLNSLLTTLNSLRARQVRYIVFSGGEPLLHPLLEPLIASTVSYDIRTSIATNAVAATPSLCKQLALAGLTKATVSLDGAKAEEYESIRRAPKAFPHILRGINSLMEAGISVSTNTVLHPSNMYSVEQIINLAVSLGVETIAFTIPVCSGLGRGTSLGFIREARMVISEIIPRIEQTLKSSIKIEVHDPQCLNSDCPAGKAILGVNEFGEIVPCLVKEWAEAPSAINFVAMTSHR